MDVEIFLEYGLVPLVFCMKDAMVIDLFNQVQASD
jgi:hypothetical protein